LIGDQLNAEAAHQGNRSVEIMGLPQTKVSAKPDSQAIV